MTAQPRSVIVAAVRTPVGKFGGAFREVPAVELGAAAIRAVLDRAAAGSKLGDPAALGDHVDYVLMGHVLQAGAGQNTARQAAVAGGLPAHVPAMTLNKVCLASLSAVALADQLIRAGEIEVAVAGGMESMSQAPYVAPHVRWGSALGDRPLVDTMVHDGLWSTFTGQHMGESSDDINATLRITRAEQDAWAARSHQRAADAWTAGRFEPEVVPVETSSRPGPVIVARDEGIRATTTLEGLAALPAAFHPNGTITAGNASQLSDGAAALIVMRADRAEAMGIDPLVEILAHGMCADDFAWLHTVPAVALQRALKKASVGPDDLGVVEINEAFASVALHATRMLEADEAIVNVNGGSVALGHALGATGARMTATLVHEMVRRQATFGGVTLCGGGGQGEALVLRLAQS
ncbi:MAG TPA: acetyl-CoA C-acyltransferase [Acidimicrobiales bacterium]|nr:acetyl-CoA C-acyltransferase [Acidimicrobiales bacterium]